MNSRRCMISSFEVRTYSTTTLGTAQGCQLYGPNQESKARSDYVIAQPSMLHASRRPVSLRCDGRGHREWPCFHGVKLNLPQLGGHGPRPYASSPHRCRAEGARLNLTSTIRWATGVEQNEASLARTKSADAAFRGL